VAAGEVVVGEVADNWTFGIDNLAERFDIERLDMSLSTYLSAKGLTVRPLSQRIEGIKRSIMPPPLRISMIIFLYAVVDEIPGDDTRSPLIDFRNTWV
jgi:hypothetical protein